MINWAAVLKYEPETGLLYWRIKPAARVSAGSLAGWVDNSGYRRILYKRGKYQAHRIIWDILHPEDPIQDDEDIDHIDHDRLNNRPYNLRKASRSENMANKTLYRSNKSGVPGVCWRKDNKVWASRISCKGTHIHLGFYPDWFDAVCARKSAEYKFGFHHNHGVKL